MIKLLVYINENASHNLHLSDEMGEAVFKELSEAMKNKSPNLYVSPWSLGWRRIAVDPSKILVLVVEKMPKAKAAAIEKEVALIFPSEVK
jgi:hypothetical protein